MPDSSNMDGNVCFGSQLQRDVSPSWWGRQYGRSSSTLEETCGRGSSCLGTPGSRENTTQEEDQAHNHRRSTSIDPLSLACHTSYRFVDLQNAASEPNPWKHTYGRHFRFKLQHIMLNLHEMFKLELYFQSDTWYSIESCKIVKMVIFQKSL